MGIAVIGLIVLAILALLAIPVIAAIIGRSASDEDPNETVNGDRDEKKDSTGRS